MGQRSTYTVEIAQEICGLIESGHTCRQIDAMTHMPAWSTVCDWLRKYPEFNQQYARAREISADWLEAEALAAVRNAQTSEEAQCARGILDAVKWSTAKRNPKVYGEKLDVAVTTNIADSIERMRARRNVRDTDGE
jgi:hypothetical protein